MKCYECVFAQNFEPIKNDLKDFWQINNSDKDDLYLYYYDNENMETDDPVKLPKICPEFAQYLRLLHHIVKYIVEYDTNVLMEDEKYQYLKTLRTQLSPNEQLFLLFNSFSIWGEVWIIKGYITKYRMCKNILENVIDTLEIDVSELYTMINKKLNQSSIYDDFKVTPNGKNKFDEFIFQFAEE